MFLISRRPDIKLSKEASRAPRGFLPIDRILFLDSFLSNLKWTRIRYGEPLHWWHLLDAISMRVIANYSGGTKPIWTIAGRRVRYLALGSFVLAAGQKRGRNCSSLQLSNLAQRHK